MQVQTLQNPGTISNVGLLPKPQSLTVKKLPAQPSLSVSKPLQSQPLSVQPVSQPKLNPQIMQSTGRGDNGLEPYNPKADLTPENRTKLNDVVHQMTLAGEPEEAIQTAVGQFKTKYGGQQIDQSTSENKPKVGLFGSGISSLIASAKATPSIIRAFGGKAIGDKEYENQNLNEATQRLTNPNLGYKPLSATSNKEALGLGTEAAGYGLAIAGAPSLGFGVAGFGNGLEDNKAVLYDTNKSATENLLGGNALSEGVLSALFAKGADKYGSKILGGAYNKLVPQVAKDVIEPLAIKAGNQLNKGLGTVGDIVNPYLDKVVPDFVSGKALPQIAKEKLTAPAIKSLESTYNELFTGTKSGNKVLNKSLQVGKDPAKFLAENGYVVDVSSGKINAQPVIQKITQDVEPLEQTLDDILKVKSYRTPDSELINLDDVATQAKQKINTSIARGGGTLQDQEKAIDNIVSNLKQTYGDRVNLSQLNEIKRGQWKESSAFNLNRPTFMGDVNYTLGNIAKETIENSVPEIGIKKLNSQIGNHFDAIQNLRKVDGNTVKGGRLGKYFARQIGAIAGSAGGPLGTVAGAYTADYISEVMQNTAISTPAKRAILESIQKDNPFYREAQTALQQLKFGQPLLEAPLSGRPKSANNVPMELPSQFHPLETGNVPFTQPNQLKLPAPSGVERNAIRLPARIRPLEINNSVRSLNFKPKDLSNGRQEITQIFGEGKLPKKPPKLKK